jgi:hypothetical protein
MNDLPFMVHAWTILFIFVCELILFHGVFYLIRDEPSIKGICAIVHYVVYGLAMLGLLGAVSNAGSFGAQSLFDYGKPLFHNSNFNRCGRRWSDLVRRAGRCASAVGGKRRVPANWKRCRRITTRPAPGLRDWRRGCRKGVPENFSAIDWSVLSGERV